MSRGKVRIPSFLRRQARRGAEGLGAEPEREETSGRPLDLSVRKRMERALGADLSQVRVHTGEAAASEARAHRARAFAVGRHVAFDRGEYRPGTPVGDALLAHELAHTVQQDGAEAGKAMKQGGPSANRLEADANRSALGALGALWGGAARAAGGAVRGVGPRLRSGGQMQLMRCEREPEREVPDFLGPESRETLERLEQRLDILEDLGPLIVAGTTVAVGASQPSIPSGEVEAAAQALQGLPTMERSVIHREVGRLLAMHREKLNDQEREFWRAILENVERPSETEAETD